MAETTTGIAVARINTVAYLRIVGRGTFQNSQPLHRFTQQMLEQGCREFVLDLSRCQSMDSTFLGVLAGVSLRLRQEAKAGGVRIINAGPHNLESLRCLGLDRLFTVEPVETLRELPADTDFQWLADSDITNLPKPLDRFDTAELMLEAHANLARADARNLAKLSDLTELLRQKVHSNPPAGECPAPKESQKQ